MPSARRAFKISIETFFALDFRLFLVFISQLPRETAARSRRERPREIRLRPGVAFQGGGRVLSCDARDDAARIRGAENSNFSKIDLHRIALTLDTRDIEYREPSRLDWV